MKKAARVAGLLLHLKSRSDGASRQCYYHGGLTNKAKGNCCLHVCPERDPQMQPLKQPLGCWLLMIVTTE